MNTVKERENLILSIMAQLNSASVSEVIDSIWNGMSDDKKIEVGWRFFVHLNKLFTLLEKKGRIKCIGVRAGYMNRPEKVWVVTK